MTKKQKLFNVVLEFIKDKIWINLFIINVGVYSQAPELLYDAVNDYYKPGAFISSIDTIKKPADLLGMVGAHQSHVNTEYRSAVVGRASEFARAEVGKTIGDCMNESQLIQIRSPCLSMVKQAIEKNKPKAEFDIKKEYESKMHGSEGSLCKIINIFDSKNGKVICSGYIIKSELDEDPWNHPVIVADGFDPSNCRTIFNLIIQKEFNKLIALGPGTITGLGYDVCFVDFADGTADIRDNAKAMLKVIEIICQRSTPGVVVGGFSMGGQIARLALLYGQKQNGGVPSAEIGKVNKFLSIDSPNQGANISIDLQKFVQKKQPEVFTSGLGNIAARQMLFQNVLGGENNPNPLGEPYGYDHDKFYSFLHLMGNYPKNMELISIADACWQHFFTKWEECHYKIIAYDVAVSGVLLYLFPWTRPKAKVVESICLQGRDFEPGSYFSIYSSTIIPEAGQQINEQLNKEVFPPITLRDLSVHVDQIQCEDIWGNILEPTFMPITSVFDLRYDTPLQLQAKKNTNFETLITTGMTPFQKLYCLNNRNIHAAVHIDFTDNELLGYIMDALGKPTTNISSVRRNYFINTKW